MARAFVDHGFRRRQALVLLGATLVLFAAIFLVAMDTSYGLGTRLGWSLGLDFVPTVLSPYCSQR